MAVGKCLIKEENFARIDERGYY